MQEFTIISEEFYLVDEDIPERDYIGNHTTFITKVYGSTLQFLSSVSLHVTSAGFLALPHVVVDPQIVGSDPELHDSILGIDNGDVTFGNGITCSSAAARSHIRRATTEAQEFANRLRRSTDPSDYTYDSESDTWTSNT